MAFSREQRYDLKLKALYYYYKQKEKLSDIAKRLNVSRITLNKLLQEAEDEGLIKIEIIDVQGAMEILELEEKVRQRFSLHDVRIVNSHPDNFQFLVRDIALAGAQYVDSMMHDGIKIAVSWGKHLDLLTQYMKPNNNCKKIEVFTLLGGAGIADSQIQPNIIAQNLLRKFNGVGYVINAPFICPTKELCDAIKSESHIQSIIKNSVNADITLVGIGSTPNVVLNRKYFHYDETILREMQSLQACGDICSNFYDIHGNICKSSIHDRFVAININDLKKHNLVVGVAGGDHKIASILGALNGGYLDVLITDKYTITQVMALADSIDTATPNEKITDL